MSLSLNPDSSSCSIHPSSKDADSDTLNQLLDYSSKNRISNLMSKNKQPGCFTAHLASSQPFNRSSTAQTGRYNCLAEHLGSCKMQCLPQRARVPNHSQPGMCWSMGKRIPKFMPQLQKIIFIVIPSVTDSERKLIILAR